MIELIERIKSSMSVRLTNIVSGNEAGICVIVEVDNPEDYAQVHVDFIPDILIEIQAAGFSLVEMECDGRAPCLIFAIEGGIQ